MSVVLITGCSSGFGKHTALEFARRGDTVFASMRDTSKSGALLGEASGIKGQLEVIQLDVRDRASVDAAVAGVLARAGHIDVLVCNAGVDATGPIEAFDDDELEMAFQTNVFGVHRVTRAALPSMRARRAGVIILVGLIQGRMLTAPFNGVYAATKHAAQALYDALYFELRPFNINVVIVEPGNFATEIWKRPNPPRAFPEAEAGWSKPAGATPAVTAASSPHGDAEYSRLYAAMLDNIGSMGTSGADPAVVARLLTEIAHDRRPQRRYVVGDDARTMDGQTPDELEAELWKCLSSEPRSS